MHCALFTLCFCFCLGVSFCYTHSLSFSSEHSVWAQVFGKCSISGSVSVILGHGVHVLSNNLATAVRGKTLPG